MLVEPSPNVQDRVVIVPLPAVEASAKAQFRYVQVRENPAVGGVGGGGGGGAFPAGTPAITPSSRAASVG